MANTIRIKRSTLSAAPTTAANAELAFSEQNKILWYGIGTGGAGGTATSLISIGGEGAFTTLGTAQTISGIKTFTGATILGTPASGTLTNCTGLVLTTGQTGILPVANGGTGFGTAAATVFALKGANSDITSLSGLTTPLTVAQGGTGATTSTGTGSVVLSASPTFTGTLTCNDLTVNGTTTTVNSTTINITNSFTFEGSTADGFETVLGVVDPTVDRTILLPNADDTLVGKATTDTLTNKSIAASTNTITGLTNTNLSGTAAISNANLANSTVIIGSTSVALGATVTTFAGLTSVSSAGFTGPLTGNASTATSAATLTTARTIYGNSFDGSANLTQVITGTYGGTGVNNGSSTITLGGNLTTSGAFATTLTTSAATNVTLPTTGTLATLIGTETLDNKTIDGGSY